MKDLYVFNPDIKKFVPAEEWLKDPDPTRAELVGFPHEGRLLAWAKKSLGDYTFEAARKAANAFKVDGIDEEFDCPDRRMVISYQDALDNELDVLLDKIGGECSGWTWTCEYWFARRYSASYAWFFGGIIGTLNNGAVSSAHRCQAVTLLPLREAIY